MFFDFSFTDSSDDDSIIPKQKTNEQEFTSENTQLFEDYDTLIKKIKEEIINNNKIQFEENIQHIRVSSNDELLEELYILCITHKRDEFLKIIELQFENEKKNRKNVII